VRAVQVFDITVPIRPGMVVYEGDPGVALERVSAMAQGGLANVSKLDFGLHTGTHIDAPLHFIDGAAGVEETPLSALVGPAHVVDATGARGHLDADALLNLAIPAGAERVLLKTRNSKLWQREGFTKDFVALEPSAARHLVDRGVQLVGADYLSIAPADDPKPTHVELLSRGVVILEGLDLDGVEPGEYTLICLPLLVEGADGAPARALLVRN
jgi:arylformamidase